MTDALMAAIADHGAFALFAILAVNCFGVPFPTSLLLLATGAMTATGDLPLAETVALGIAGAVAGDQAGFLLGRLGGGPLTETLARRFGAATAIRRAADLSARWGGLGVFLSRWLLSPLGPYVNLISGATGLSWIAFTVAGVAGEAVWVGLYVALGIAFSDSLIALSDLLGNLTWFLVGAAVAAVLGYEVRSLVRRRQGSHA